MKSVFARSLKKAYLLGGLLSIGLLFKDVRYSASILLGLVFAGVHLYKLEKDVDVILKQRRHSYLRFIINVWILIIPFVFATIFPQYFNYIGCFIGLMLNKLFFYIDGIRSKS